MGETAVQPLSSSVVSPLSDSELDSSLGDGSSGAISAKEGLEKNREKQTRTIFMEYSCDFSSIATIHKRSGEKSNNQTKPEQA